ncbi:hypothetical protein GCM10010415_66160 [Streptomyces atrovirens]
MGVSTGLSEAGSTAADDDQRRPPDARSHYLRPAKTQLTKIPGKTQGKKKQVHSRKPLSRRSSMARGLTGWARAVHTPSSGSTALRSAS